MPEVLELLFGSKAKARILRFFILNPDREYDLGEIAKRNMVSGINVRRELDAFKKIKLINEKIKKGKKYYELNQQFTFYPEVKTLITKSNVYPQCQSLAKMKDIGDVKLALVSGVFLNYPKSKADIVLVVNSVNKNRLTNLMKSLEAEIGREITYVLMSSEDFKYRLDMLDRFILEFLEGPHDEIVNKIPGLKRIINGLKMRR